jgi:uncharacterized cupin superfamily protein
MFQVTRATELVQSSGIHATSPNGTMMSGYSKATPGSFHATYTTYGFVHSIEGKITINPDGLTPATVKAGNALVVENTSRARATWKRRFASTSTSA